MESDYLKEVKLEKAFIYSGLEGFKKYLQDILSVGQDVYCLGAKGGWGDPALGEFGEWFNQERAKKNIKVHNLFDHEMQKNISLNKPRYAKRGEYKFLPPEYSTPSAMDIFGDYLVTFTGLSPEKINDDVTLFVLINSNLAESFRIWFKFMWESPGVK